MHINPAYNLNTGHVEIEPIFGVIAETSTTQELILDEIRKAPHITRVKLGAIIGTASDKVKYQLSDILDQHGAGSGLSAKNIG